jgi:hypothetical protein
MPSLIGSALGDNSGVTITQNYLVSKPGSQFGTRALSFYKVTSTGVATNYSTSNSLFEKAVKGIQQTSELYFVGTPASDNFVFAIASDTDAGQTGAAAYVANSAAQTIQTAVRATTGDGSATVGALTASGASIA